MCAVLYTTSSFSQKSTACKSSEKAVVKDAYTFTPPIKLLNKELWNRVSNIRFECNFLRLAVEYQDFEYVLFEMDGLKRELSRAREYRIIGEEIAINTFRFPSNSSGSTTTNSTVTSAY